jgi:hypothetical protein
MDHSIHAVRRTPARTSTRTALALIVAAVLALPAAACGSSAASTGSGGSAHTSSAHPGGSSSSPSAVGYSHCMRTHGVPRYPDPSSDGQLPKGTAQTFGVSSSQYQAAQAACRHLLPNNYTTFSASLIQCLETSSCPFPVVQRALSEGRKFAQCMRDHGVPNWPDPTIDSSGRPSFQVTKAGISIAATRSRRLLSKIGYCQRYLPVLLRQE